MNENRRNDKRAHICDPAYTVYDITDKTHYLDL